MYFHGPRSADDTVLDDFQADLWDVQLSWF